MLLYDSRDLPIKYKFRMRVFHLILCILFGVMGCAKRNPVEVPLTLIDTTTNTMFIDSGQSSIVNCN